MNLFDLPTRDISSPDSLDSAHSLPIIRKSNFDDRAQTRISLLLKSSQQVAKSAKENYKFDFIPLNWSPWSGLVSFFSTSANAEYGSPSYILPASLFLIIGTDNGHILAFNYAQKLVFSLSCASHITSLAISSDSTHLALGLQNGEICVWNLQDLPQISLVYLIEPISLAQRFTNNSLGHLNVPIDSIAFIGESNSQLVSCDVSGLVFYHNIFKKFFNSYASCQKLLGNNDSNINNSEFTILASRLLPLGNSHQITDQLGVMAIITKSALTIVSILSLNNPTAPNVKTHYRVGKSSSEPDTVASLDWFPCMEISNEIVNAKLSYSWDNTLTILEVDNKSFPKNYTKLVSQLKDKDKAISTIPIRKTCRWSTPKKQDKIISNKWLSLNILSVFVQSDDYVNVHLLHYHDEKLHLIAVDKLVPELTSSTLTGVSNNNRDRNVDRAIISWENCINVHKNRLIVLSNAKIYIGTLISWANRLVQLLLDQDYSQALLVADEYYNLNDIGKASLLELPRNTKTRQHLLEPYLIRVIKESIDPLFKEYSGEQEYYLDKYLEIISYLFENTNIVPQLHEILEAIFSKCDDQSLFFASLQAHILNGSITSLPPLVLRVLVETYVNSGSGDLLTEILCLLDLKSLDIDLTVNLCKKYNLRDCLIYIWNGLLNDYATPLLDFITDIVNDDINEEDTLRVYSYMSYILTGKKYPTDQYIDVENFHQAKSSICEILFSNTLVKNNNTLVTTKQPDTIFPYLFLFLQVNSFEMVSTLNEFFEDPYLNKSEEDNNGIDRQYVVEALLDIYEVKKYAFSDYDRCQLAIFIARNYPKYSQFLRLSESVLDRIIRYLYENTDPTIANDCQLAMQSLLPYYEPESEEFLIEHLHAAKYYDVLMNVYRSSGKYGKVLEIWLCRDKYEEDYETLSSILENSFLSCKNPMEYLKLSSVIKSNFEKLISIDLEHFIAIISKYAPSLHMEILEITNNQQAYSYLELLFASEVKAIDNYEILLKRYIELGCYQAENVFSIVEQWKSTIIQIADLESTYKVFRSSGAIDSLAVVLVGKKMYSEALTSLLEYMETLIKNEETHTRFNYMLEHAMKCCEESPMDKQDEEEMYLNESLWLKLINKLVGISNEHNNEVSNAAIYECFRRISDSKLNPVGTQEQSFLIIFNKFLEGLTSGSQRATLSNIRGILQEVFVSYSYESEMLEISLRMLNGSIHTTMGMIRGQRLKGWILKSKVCASCNKPIWGSDISEDHYLAWESKQKDLLFVRTTENKSDKFNHCQLIVFKCSHGYHAKCLQNLSGGDLSNPVCVICTKS